MIPWFLVDRPFLGAQVAGLDWSFWNIVGWTGNAVFSARFFVQWWATEKHKQVVVPNVFWWLSLIGSLCLLAYGLWRRDGVFVFAYLLDYFAGLGSVSDYLLAGFYWLLMVLAFEWIGSLLIRRPIREILVGWHIERGYMWPYVLLTYLLSPLVVGLLLNPASG